jgi:hypothetical protein
MSQECKVRSPKNELLPRLSLLVRPYWRPVTGILMVKLTGVAITYLPVASLS